MARQVSVGSLPDRTVTRDHKVLVQTGAGTGLVTLEDAVTAVGAVTSIISDESPVSVQGGSVSRPIKEKFGDVISVKDFGAKGDGTIGDGAAFVAAINAANAAGGGTVYMPRGTYNLKDLTARLPIGSGLVFKGDGMDQTKLIWNDNSTYRLFGTDAGLNLDNIEFQNFSVIGQWATIQNDTGQYAFLVYSFKSVAFRNVGVDYSRAMSIVVRQSQNIVVDGCRVRWSARDGINVATCPYASITNNTLMWVDDDAIAYHSATSDKIAYGNDTGTPPRDTVVITGNRVFGCGGGISALAPRIATISGNTISRCSFHGIAATATQGGGSTEGRAQTHSIAIVGNTITDIFNRTYMDALNGGANYIVVNGVGVPGALAAVPGQNDAATGAIIDPYASNYTNSITAARPHGRGVTVVGNTLSRTIRRSGNYSDMGFGEWFLRSGWIDPALDTGILDGTGIEIQRAIKQLIISSNNISGLSKGINIAPQATDAPLCFEDIIIQGNTFADFVTGISFSSPIGDGHSVRILQNTFNGDPFHLHSNRGANGTFLADNLPVGIGGTAMTGAYVEGNLFKNVARTMDATSSAGTNAAFVRDNIVEGEPAVIGFSTSNKGIGNAPRGGRRFTYRVVDCDPASANYGKVKNVCHLESNAIPTTGTFMIGHFIANNSPTIASGKVLTGWLRTTLGSAHVSGTDWAPVYGTTS